MCKKSLEKEPFEWGGEGRSVYVQRRQVGGLGWDRQWQGTSLSRRLTVEDEERQGQPQTVGHSRYWVS